MIYLTNILAMIFSFGLLYPWAKVRLQRYLTETISLQIEGDLNRFMSRAKGDQLAFGEERGEVFDLDLDLGF